MIKSDKALLPGVTLGILGGGQLGRLFVLAAREMGYRVMVLDPDRDSPAGALANEHIRANYDDVPALQRMARACAAVTTEFENVPAEALRLLMDHCPVRPSAQAVAMAQHRVQEKQWLRAQGFATAPFAVVSSEEDLVGAAQLTGFPAVLKVARFGYDGKGQARVADLAEAQHAFVAMGRETCVLERLVALQMEVSVVLARNPSGQTVCFPVAENQHVNGILDISIAPARVDAALADAASAMAVDIATRLDYSGVLAVEFFVTTDGGLLVNELAPRPHNSGHYTLDACRSSQFELQVRALCNLPLGGETQHTPAVMVNLLGDVWQHGAPDWGTLLRHPQVKLHCYGKNSARPGRKMAHFTCMDASVDMAVQLAQSLRDQLKGNG